MRKLFLFSALVCFATMFTGCLDVPEPQYSPQILGSYFYVNPVFSGDTVIGAQDTLDIKEYDSEDETYNLDTVFMGDTVMFAARFYTFANDLVSVDVDWEKNHIDLWYYLNDSVKSALTSETDTAAGKLMFDPGYNGVSFPIYFTPIVKGGTTLKLTVVSNSEYSTSFVKLYIPIQEK